VITIGTIVIGPGVRDSVLCLADNDWLTITVEGGQTGIRCGTRARKLLEEGTATDVTGTRPFSTFDRRSGCFYYGSAAPVPGAGTPFHPQGHGVSTCVPSRYRRAHAPRRSMHAPEH
jgi:hypothetical protein